MIVTPASTTGSVVLPSETAPGRISGSAPFANLVDRFLSGAADSHQTADANVRELVMGNTENMHSVLMQVAQADLNFRMILEIRNRLSDAYQEIMKMQV